MFENYVRLLLCTLKQGYKICQTLLSHSCEYLPRLKTFKKTWQDLGFNNYISTVPQPHGLLTFADAMQMF